MWTITISMVIFHRYVKLPEGKQQQWILGYRYLFEQPKSWIEPANTRGYIYIYIDGTYITNIKLIWYLQTTGSFEELGRWRCDHSVWLTGMGTGCRSLEDLGIFRETRLKTHKSNTQNKCMDYDSGWWFQTWILFSIMYIYIYIWDVILPIVFHIFQDG